MSSSATIIENMHNDNKGILQYLSENGEISYASLLDEKLKKMLLLSAASYFEKEITDTISKYVEKVTNQNETVTAFVQKKAISRQYHTYFNWDASNCNSFLGLFGQQFKEEVQKEIEIRELEKSVKNFLELGKLRNLLVHSNAATFSIDKTSDEIFDLYKSAQVFINFIKEKLDILD